VPHLIVLEGASRSQPSGILLAPSRNEEDMAKKKAAKRERIDTKVGGTRFVRRDDRGTFNESDQAGPSLRADRRTKSETKVRSGQGDKGDRQAGRS